MTRPARVVAILALAAASGCYRYAGHEIARAPSAEQPALRRDVRTFVIMRDGIRRPFRDAVIVGDSLYGWSQESGAPRANPVAIPLERIQRVDQQKSNRVLAAIVLVAGMTISVIGAVQIAHGMRKDPVFEPF